MNRGETLLNGPTPRSLELAYTETGPQAGPPVLVLHGITCSRRYWLPSLQHLSRRYRLIVPDLPGFGQSPKPVAEYDMDFFHETLLGLLERCGLGDQPITIIGHSLGGLLALEHAARKPGTVEKLILLNLPRFTNPELAHRAMAEGSSSYRKLLTFNSPSATFAQMRRTGWRLLARYLLYLSWPILVDARKFTFRSLSSTLENCLLEYSLDGALERCPADLPTLLIHGDRDQAAPLKYLRDLHSRPPFPLLRVIPGAGHHPFLTHRQDSLALMESFLACSKAQFAGERRGA